MIGDPLILSSEDYKRAKDIWLKNKNDNDIFLIGGASGTAKSELSYCLQKTIFELDELSSIVISLDDYYFTMPSIRRYNRKKQGIDSVGLQEVDWDYMQRIYDDYQDEKEIHLKRVHRFLDEIEHSVLNGEDIDVIIFEGLYANYLRKFYSNNFSIFLEGNPEQTLEFRKLRGKEKEEDAFRTKVVQKEFNIVSQLKRYADLILEFKEKK